MMKKIKQLFNKIRFHRSKNKDDNKRIVAIPAAELPRRRQAWTALSELWLDTELQESDLKWIASRMVATGYSWPEIERICLNEVAPALFDNLRVPAGAWAGFDPEWLEECILNLIGRPDHDAWVAQNRDKLRQFIGQDWHAVTKLFQELQVSGH